MRLMLPGVPEIKDAMLKIASDGEKRNLEETRRLIVKKYCLSPHQATNPKFYQRVYNAKRALKKEGRLADIHGHVQLRSPSDPGDLRQRPVFRDGKEPFQHHGASVEFTVYDYWKWMGSDLLSNINRGILAEFLVAKILGAEEETLKYPRSGWESYDIMYYSQTDGSRISIEVKSAAYFQSWHRNRDKPSVVKFDIAPKASVSKLVGKPERAFYVDAFVFCVLGKRGAIPCPLDLGQWEFYVFMSAVLDEVVGNQKEIGLSRLQELVDCRRGLRTANHKQLSRVIEKVYCRNPPKGGYFADVM